jgi:hypothetical protein
MIILARPERASRRCRLAKEITPGSPAGLGYEPLRGECAVKWLFAFRQQALPTTYGAGNNASVLPISR